MSFHPSDRLPEELRELLHGLGNEGVSAQTLLANYLDETASSLAYDGPPSATITRGVLLGLLDDVQAAILAARITLGDSVAAAPRLLVVNDLHSAGHTAADLRLIEHATKQYHRDGEIEIDEPTIISRGDTSGAYIMAWVWQEYDLREKLEYAVSEVHVPADETLAQITTKPKPDEIDDDVWTLLDDLVKEDYGSLTPASALCIWPTEYDADEEESEDVLYAALEQQHGQS